MHCKFKPIGLLLAISFWSPRGFLVVLVVVVVLVVMVLVMVLLVLFVLVVVVVMVMVVLYRIPIWEFPKIGDPNIVP